MWGKANTGVGKAANRGLSASIIVSDSATAKAPTSVPVTVKTFGACRPGVDHHSRTNAASVVASPIGRKQGLVTSRSSTGSAKCPSHQTAPGITGHPSAAW